MPASALRARAHVARYFTACAMELNHQEFASGVAINVWRSASRVSVRVRGQNARARNWFRPWEKKTGLRF